MEIQVDAKTVYKSSPEAGCYIYRYRTKVAKSIEAHEAVILDFDKDDNLIGVEVLASVEDMRQHKPRRRWFRR